MSLGADGQPGTLGTQSWQGQHRRRQCITRIIQEDKKKENLC